MKAAQDVDLEVFALELIEQIENEAVSRLSGTLSGQSLNAENFGTYFSWFKELRDGRRQEVNIILHSSLPYKIKRDMLKATVEDYRSSLTRAVETSIRHAKYRTSPTFDSRIETTLQHLSHVLIGGKTLFETVWVDVSGWLIRKPTVNSKTDKND